MDAVSDQSQVVWVECIEGGSGEWKESVVLQNSLGDALMTYQDKDLVAL